MEETYDKLKNHALVGNLTAILEIIIAEETDKSHLCEFLLKLSARHGTLDVAQMIITHFSDHLKDVNDKFLFMLAVVSKQVQMVEFLRGYGAIVGCLNIALCAACCNGSMEIVDILLKAGANPNALNGYSTRLAASNGHLDIIKKLVNFGADITLNNNDALSWAYINRKTEVVTYLIAHGADPKIIDRPELRNNSYLIYKAIQSHGYFIEMVPSDTTYDIVRTSMKYDCEENGRHYFVEKDSHTTTTTVSDY